MTKLSHLLAGVALATLLPGIAFAQEEAATTETAPAAEEELQGANEIIVTATRRSQVVQDVPLAVSVVSAELVKNAGIDDIRGIRQLSPSLQTTTGQSAATGTVLRIRGIGTAGDNPGFEPSVAVFIDGVFRSRSGVALADLPPLERVEVLRGPQGTLFGRNSSAGALSVITEGPEFNLGGYGEFAYGNLDEIEARAGIYGPVSETLALRVDGSYHTRDGYIRDVNSDRRINDLDRWSVRGQALYETETVKFRLIADYAKTDEQCCGALNTGSGFVLYPTVDTSTGSLLGLITSNVVQGLSALAGNVGIVTPFEPERRRQAISPNRSYGEAVDEWGVSGELNWELNDNVTFTGITAYRDWKVVRDQDIDFSGLDRAYRDGYRNGLRDFTQEIRFQGSAFDDKVDWLVGGFYLNESLSLTDTVRFGTQADPFVDSLFNQLTRSALLPSGAQLFGTLGPTVPLFGQVALASNPALAAAAAAGGPAVLGTFLNPLPATPNGAGQVADRYNVDTNAFAIFTHNIINVTDKLSITLGLRYNYEKKDITANLNSAVPACDFLQNPNSALFRSALNGSGLLALTALYACNPTINTEFNGNYDGDRSDSVFTGTARLSYKISDDVLVYGGYDRGYKSGGYNLDRATFDTALLGGNGAQIEDLEFAKETVDSYEVGIKTDLTREFSLNVTGFWADFSNFQDLTFIGTSFVVSSIDKVTSRGVEVEAVIRPVRDLVVNAGYSYIKAEYQDDTLPPELAGSNGVQVTNQPTSTVTTALTWTPQISDNVGGLFHVDARLNSGANTINAPLAVPFTTNDSYIIVNLRAGVNLFNEKLSVEGYVENLFDTYYNITAFPVPEQGNSYAVYPSTPRFYGVRVRYSF